jgi:hypothetical protein
MKEFLHALEIHEPDAAKAALLTDAYLEQNRHMLVEPEVGLKFDQEKPDLSLLPREFLDEVAKAMMHGEKKYGRYNYTNGLAWSRVIAACLRHITAFAAGEDNDSESGVSHLGHAGACILMLCVYFKRSLGTDNREKK